METLEIRCTYSQMVVIHIWYYAEGGISGPWGIGLHLKGPRMFVNPKH